MAKRLIKQHRVVVGHEQTAGSAVFGKHEETEDTEQAFLERSAEVVSLCVHGHTMRTIQEVGGACAVCGGILCTACATLRCDIDGHILCRLHAELFGERAICATHGFFDMLRYTFSP